MFKGMHPIFWVGIAIMYGLSIVFWIIEIASNTGTWTTSIAGIPAPFVYNNLFMIWLVPIFIAWLWYYFPEKTNKEKASQGKEE